MTTRRLSREDLIEALHKLAERVGRTPIEYDTYDYPDIPSHTIFVKRFGTWREALQAAGIPLNPQYMGYDPEDLLEHLRTVAEGLGRTPTQAELRETGGPHPATYRAHFGSWKAALAEVGLEPRCGRRYETEELLQILRELAEELGRTPTIAELQARADLPSPYTYRDRFGRWNEALGKAGLTPRYLRAVPLVSAHTIQGSCQAGRERVP
jgi:hypothetical protein